MSSLASRVAKARPHPSQSRQDAGAPSVRSAGGKPAGRVPGVFRAGVETVAWCFERCEGQVETVVWLHPLNTFHGVCRRLLAFRTPATALRGVSPPAERNPWSPLQTTASTLGLCPLSRCSATVRPPQSARLLMVPRCHRSATDVLIPEPQRGYIPKPRTSAAQSWVRVPCVPTPTGLYIPPFSQLRYNPHCGSSSGGGLHSQGLTAPS